jgi:hypothetical protein
VLWWVDWGLWQPMCGPGASVPWGEETTKQNDTGGRGTHGPVTSLYSNSEPTRLLLVCVVRRSYRP